MKKIDWICVGVQKAGTTSLHALLRDHTDLELFENKEVHYFDDEEIDWQNPDYGRYHGKFHDVSRIWGEITPIYIYMPGCLERIRIYNGNIKIIVIFRDPIDRAYSHWCMERARGWETLSFSDAIRETGRVRFREAGWHRVYSYVERGMYGAQMRRLLENFPRRNLFCTDFAVAMADQSRLVKQVAAFIGASANSCPTSTVKIHARLIEAPDMTLEDELYLASLYREDFKQFMELSGLECLGWRMRHHIS